MANPIMLIKVGEKEFKGLLDSEGVRAEISDKLKPWTDLIRDITNYGSNLIPRCYSSSEKDMKDVVVLAILLRQVVAMLDSIAIQLENGAVHAAQLQLRALFEASLYIDWILQSDSPKKASYYYVHNLRRKRLWAVRTQSGLPEADEFIKEMNNTGVQISDDLKKRSKEQLQEINRILSQPALDAINRDFDRCRKGKHDCAWYVPLGQPLSQRSRGR